MIILAIALICWLVITYAFFKLSVLIFVLIKLSLILLASIVLVVRAPDTSIVGIPSVAVFTDFFNNSKIISKSSTENNFSSFEPKALSNKSKKCWRLNFKLYKSFDVSMVKILTSCSASLITGESNSFQSSVNNLTSEGFILIILAGLAFTS